MGIGKRFCCVWLSAVLFCALLCSPALASETEQGPEEREFEFSVGVYNDVLGEYALKNRTVDAFGGVTIDRSIAILLQKGMLESYTQSEDRLLSLSYRDDSDVLRTLNENVKRKFYVKLNGEALRPEDASNLYIHDGDLIEWIYTTADRYASVSERGDEAPASSQAQAPAESWTAAASAVQSAACDWLDDRAGTSAGYLIAIGSAGRSANINVVNRLLAEVRKTESSDSPTALADQILKLSFCGFDATNPDLSELLNRLMEQKGCETWTVQELCAVLTAYDCRGYTVPGGVANNRDALLASLLDCQRESGGFANSPAVNESLTVTAAAVTALSAYSSRSTVRDAIDRALGYLAELQTDDGQFRILRKDSSEALSQVIIALMSAGVHLRDERFLKGEENLLALLLEYQQADGGFSPTLDGKSESAATENAVTALAALRRGGNPYRVASSLKNTVPVSSQAPLQEIDNGRTGYWIAGGALLGLFVLAVVAVLLLKRGRRDRG